MATIAKAELKIEIATSIGADLEDMMTSAMRLRDQQDGGKLALIAGSRSVLGLSEHLRKDIEDGTLNLEGITPEETKAIILRYITRASGILDNMANGAQSQVSVAEGMVAAYKRAMSVPTKMIERERAKASAVQEAAVQEANGDGPSDFVDPDFDPRRPIARVTGVHPGDPLASRRNQEAAEPSSDSNSALIKRRKKKSAENT